MTRWKKIGEFGVGAGLCWIGEHCYIIHTKKLSSDMGKSWDDFVNKMHRDDEVYRVFDIDTYVYTEYTERSYPVFARFGKGGKILELRIDFKPRDEET